MTNGKCIYCEKVDYKSRMALEKDDFRRFTVICEFVLQEIGSQCLLYQGWKWAFKCQVVRCALSYACCEGFSD